MVYVIIVEFHQFERRHEFSVAEVVFLANVGL